jgi:hypothetical protein
MTTIEISSRRTGAVYVHSDCRDQICVNAGWLDRGGEWAACLPNRVILRIDQCRRKTPLRTMLREIDATAF